MDPELVAAEQPANLDQEKKMNTDAIDQKNDAWTIPDHILNAKIEPPGTKQAKQRRVIGKEPKRSQFIITINPNVKRTSYADLEARKAHAQRLLNVNKLIRDSFANGQLLKAKSFAVSNWVPPKLISYRCQLEIGDISGALHSHSQANFNGQCHVDLTKVRHLLVSNGFRGARIQCLFVKDSKQDVLDYITKQTNEQTMTERSEPQTVEEYRSRFPPPSVVSID